MLEEIRTENVSVNGRTRVWYHSAGGDLFVWRDAGGRAVQLEVSCFDSAEERREWWVSWNGQSVKTGWVDSREVDGREHDLESPVVEMSQEARPEALERLGMFLRSQGQHLPADLQGLLEGFSKGDHEKHS